MIRKKSHVGFKARRYSVEIREKGVSASRNTRNHAKRNAWNKGMRARNDTMRTMRKLRTKNTMVWKLLR